MQVAALYIYPVKSLGGQRLERATPQQRGFVDDRRWMFVDQNGRFISQRSNPGLARFAAETFGERGLRISEISGNRPILELADARPLTQPDVEVTVWDDTFSATLVDDPAIADAAKALGLSGARLVYMNPDVHRPVDPRYAKDREEVSFADGYPYLIATTASLEDLAAKVGEPLDMLRFRPNIVLSSSEPYAEDAWQELTIGNHQFYLPKPCARCVMITHEPETGEKNLRVLAELAGYRKVGNKVLFGVNAVWTGGEGEIFVGQELS